MPWKRCQEFDEIATAGMYLTGISMLRVARCLQADVSGRLQIADLKAAESVQHHAIGRP
ncbi:hypothetical protein RA210_U10213 [Rubrivivax sp. A210]|nr:hypothetical protein RA210_U10213 [Rubrivivax sp. A210]